MSQMPLFRLDDVPEIGEYVRCPEGRGKVEDVWRPGDDTRMRKDDGTIPDEPCVAVRYLPHSWAWWLLSEIEREDT